MELNEGFTHLMLDEPPGYRPPDFASNLRMVADLYSTAQTNALLDLKVNQADYDATVLAINTDLATKAPIASPVFTGLPQAPTPATLNNSTALATTAYVIARIANDYTAADVLAKIKTVDGIGSGLDSEFLGGVAYSDYAKLASPAFSGNPTVPNQSSGDISSRIANTQHVTDKINLAFATNYTPADILTKLKTVDGAGSGLDTDFFRGEAPSAFVKPADLTIYAPLNSPGFTGTPTAPTPSAAENSTRIATTAFVKTSFAPLASPALTGTPTAPTPTAGDNDTSIATTAFVQTALGAIYAVAHTWGGLQTFSDGISLGSTVAASPQTLTDHIALYGTSYGFSITSNTINYVAGSATANHVFWGGTSGTVELARIDSSGALTLGTPLAISEGGTGATTQAGARTALGLAAVAASGSASDLTTGTLPDARLTGSYTGIVNFTMSGTLTIQSSAPILRLADTTTSAYDARLRLDANNVYFDSSSDGVTYSEFLRFEADTKQAYFQSTVHVTTGGEALRLIGSASTTDPYISFYQGATRGAYIQYKDGTTILDGLLLLNDVATGGDLGLVLRNTGGVDSLGYRVGAADYTVYHTGNLAAADLNSIYGYTPASNAISITAGNGLTGGGTLSASRTLTLGTPGSVTGSSTNSVSATSHTHELVLASGDITGALGYTPASNAISMVAGNGLTGGGTLAASRTLTLGTPGNITNATTNSVTTTSHTHALGFVAAEVYQGTGNADTNMPLGHIIIIDDASVDRNGLVTPRISTGTTIYVSGGTDPALVGTYRARGTITMSGNSAVLAQRVA